MNRPEQDLQKSVVEYLTLVKPKCLWFHPANGGWRSPVEAAIFKGMGVMPGTPDLIFLWWNGCGAIELKTAKGKQSINQFCFQAWADLERVPYRIARSLEDVELILKEWGRIR